MGKVKDGVKSGFKMFFRQLSGADKIKSVKTEEDIKTQNSNEIAENIEFLKSSKYMSQTELSQLMSAMASSEVLELKKLIVSASVAKNVHENLLQYSKHQKVLDDATHAAFEKVKEIYTSLYSGMLGTDGQLELLSNHIPCEPGYDKFMHEIHIQLQESVVEKAHMHAYSKNVKKIYEEMCERINDELNKSKRSLSDLFKRSEENKELLREQKQTYKEWEATRADMSVFRLQTYIRTDNEKLSEKIYREILGCLIQSNQTDSHEFLECAKLQYKISKVANEADETIRKRYIDTYYMLFKSGYPLLSELEDEIENSKYAFEQNKISYEIYENLLKFHTTICEKVQEEASRKICKEMLTEVCAEIEKAKRKKIEFSFFEQLKSHKNKQKIDKQDKACVEYKRLCKEMYHEKIHMDMLSNVTLSGKETSWLLECIKYQQKLGAVMDEGDKIVQKEIIDTYCVLFKLGYPLLSELLDEIVGKKYEFTQGVIIFEEYHKLKKIYKKIYKKIQKETYREIYNELKRSEYLIFQSSELSESKQKTDLPLKIHTEHEQLHKKIYEEVYKDLVSSGQTVSQFLKIAQQEHGKIKDETYSMEYVDAYSMASSEIADQQPSDQRKRAQSDTSSSRRSCRGSACTNMDDIAPTMSMPSNASFIVPT